MTTEVDVDGVGIIEFPEEMGEHEVDAALAKMFPKQSPASDEKPLKIEGLDPGGWSGVSSRTFTPVQLSQQPQAQFRGEQVFQDAAQAKEQEQAAKASEGRLFGNKLVAAAKAVGSNEEIDYGKIKPEEFRARVAQQANIPDSPELGSVIEPYQKAYAWLQENGPKMPPRSLQPYVLDVVQHTYQSDTEKNPPSWLTRTMREAGAGLVEVGQMVPHAVDVLTNASDKEFEESGWKDQLLSIATNPSRYTNPHASWLSNQLQSATAAIPKLGMAASMGPFGVPAMYAAPAAERTAKNILERDGSPATAIGGGVASGLGTWAVFEAVPQSIAKSFGGVGEFANFATNRVNRLIFQAAKTGTLMKASEVANAVAEEGAVYVSGKEDKSAGEIVKEQLKSLPETFFQALLFHSATLAKGKVKDRKLSRTAAEELGLGRTSEPERDKLVAELKNSPPQSPPTKGEGNGEAIQTQGQTQGQTDAQGRQEVLNEQPGTSGVAGVAPEVAAPAPAEEVKPAQEEAVTPTPSEGDTYGIKNAKMAETTGQPEPDTVGSKTLEQWRQEAMALPSEAIDATIDKWRQNPHQAATPEENAQVGRRVTELGNELRQVIDSEGAASPKTKQITDQLIELQNLSKSTGTPEAQSLVSRKMLWNDDYSLASQVVKIQEAAGEGKYLSPENLSAIAESTAKIEQLTKELEESRAENVAQRVANKHLDLIHDLHVRNANFKRQETINERTRTLLGEGGGFPWEFDESPAAGSKSDAGGEPAVKKPSAKERREVQQKRIEKAVSDFKFSLKDFLGGTTHTSGGIPVDLINKGIEVIKAYAAKSFTEFMRKIGKDLGEDAEKARPAFAAAWKQAREAGDVPGRDVDVTDMESVGRLAKQLHREVVELGTTDREEAVKAVHEELKQFLPDITRRKTEDAMSGYGEFKQLSKDEISKKIREHKGELQQTSKIADLNNAIKLARVWLANGVSEWDVAKRLQDQELLPRNTGIERRNPGDVERDLIKQVNELKKQLPVDVKSSGKSLRSPLEAAKTASTNLIRDLEKEISTGEKIVKNNTELKADSELEALRARVAELRKKHAEIFPSKAKLKAMDRELDAKLLGEWEGEGGGLKPEAGKKVLTEKQRIAAREKTLDRAIDQLESDLREGNTGPKEKKPGVTSPTIEAKLKRLEELRTKRDAIRDVGKLSPEEIKDRQYQKTLEKRLADYEGRVARGDYAKKQIVKRTPNAKQVEVIRKIDEQKTKLDDMRMAAHRENRSWREATMDRITKTLRFGLLTFSSTLEHLTGATAWRIPEMALRETVASANRMIPGKIGELFKGAPTQGGGDYGSLMKGYSSFLTAGLLDAGKTIYLGKSELSKYPVNKTIFRVIGEIPKDIRDFINEPTAKGKAKNALNNLGDAYDAVVDAPGTLHEAWKAPVARTAFENAFSRSMKWEIENGADPADATMIIRSKARALEAAFRVKLSEGNRFVDWINKFKNIDPKAAMDIQLGQLMATSAMPISRIPVNFIGQVMEHLTGMVTAYTGLGELKTKGSPGIRKGIENLTPDEKDVVCRRLVSGEIGAGLIGALSLIGFFASGNLGGLNRPGKKQQDDEKKTGQVGPLSAHLSKNPVLGALQAGETFARTKKEILEEGGGRFEAYTSAMWAVTLGLADNLPIVQAAELTSRVERDKTGNFLMKELGRRVTPGFIQESQKEEKKAEKPISKKPIRPSSGPNSIVPPKKRSLRKNG